jgi:hypothetical protein
VPFNFDEFSRIKEVKVTLQPDENGYIGRECPADECLGYFLLKDGTGPADDSAPCTCPYCGTVDAHDQFHTREQIEYAKSVALRTVTDALQRDMQKFRFRSQSPRRGLGIGLSITFKPGMPVPIHKYQEKSLETFATCTGCTQDYGVYGVFGYCPGCGIHNSLMMLERNVDVVQRYLAHADAMPDETFKQHLREDALENCVSALDGFGREVVRVRLAREGRALKPAVSFQNLEAAAKLLRDQFGLNAEVHLDADTWQRLRVGFHKRHLIAHKFGVVDAKYVEQSGDTRAVVGRRVSLHAAEIRQLAADVLQFGRMVHAQLLPETGADAPGRDAGGAG